VSRSPSNVAGRSTIDQFISQRCSRNPALLISCINNMLQFRNDSGFLSNSSGQAGVFTLYMNQGTQKSQRLRARTTDQRGIRCERQSRCGDASVEPPGLSTRVPTGTRAIRHPHRTESDLASTIGHRRDRTICPSTVSVQISRAASGSSCDCATSPRTAVRPHIPV
jgi:hypothetical protein